MTLTLLRLVSHDLHRRVQKQVEHVARAEVRKGLVSNAMNLLQVLSHQRCEPERLFCPIFYTSL